MAASQIAIAETIRGMKLALRRKRATSPARSLASSEDDADDTHTHANRGNKLRSSAQYAQEGRLDTTGGQARYKRKVQHAGRERCIIKKRPRLYDEDGDVVDPADIPSDVEEAEFGEAVEEDPFGNVQLHHLLRPLTSAAELCEHPSLSQGFTDEALLDGEEETVDQTGLADGFGEVDALLRMGRQVDSESGEGMEGVQIQDHVEPTTYTTADAQNGEAIVSAEAMTNGEPTNPTIDSLAVPDNEDQSSNSGASNPSGAPSHSMTTRARARSPQLPISPSPSPSDSASIPAIHPWFLPSSNPITLHPNPLLRGPEAEETLKMLLLYIQKTENILRHLETLYTGLARVERQRKDVWKACKAERHVVGDGKGGVVTEMSDGEDWVDVEEWGISGVYLAEGGGLEKGKDEVDDVAEEEGRRVGGRRRRVVGR
ncbi:hypothetical protein LTS14_002049 [Recurvomyces mirabilis]|uniref:uncharacterized protein n=1 Tax=Recurvomyces mirabilis TaxID=574656 RepID=UPI002DDE324C|nr:hypothetical protein LTS14_002049 [Recurvomyces mirabilis]